MLLNTHQYRHNEILFIFTIFLSVSRCRIYVIYFSSSFSSWLILLILKSQEYRHTCPLAYHLEYILLFLEDNIGEECQRFSNSKSSTSRCCLVFASLFANFSLALLIKVLLIECSSLEIVCHLTSNAIRNFHFSLVDHSTAYITKMHFVTLD